jgi:carboxypeptidase Taq
METKLNELKSILSGVADLSYAAAVLNWDQSTYMPPLGAEGRAKQLSTLQRLAHEQFTSEEVGRLLDELEPYRQELDPDSDDARLIKVARRHYDLSTKVPSRWVSEFSEASSIAKQVWQEARAENNFNKFQPALSKIVDMRREYACFFQPYDHIYDPLLDEYEPAMKTAEVKAIFEVLRPRQVELIKAIGERPQVDASFLHLDFDEKKQWDFGVEVVSKFGYDWKRGRQDKTAHPFSISFGVNDVRITTRVMPNYIGSALFGTMHEAGHALYEMGVNPSYDRTPLANGASLAIHESQSRLWENLVGRSFEFWEYFYPRLKEYFPSQFVEISLETFYKGINQVQPTLIRVEADEATYNLHIMLRLEIEIALMEDQLSVNDLPEVWNTRMEEYLGLTPPNDAQGVLQDIHWSLGYVGYFSTYALGNLVSVQLWERIEKELPDIKDQIRKGDFSGLLEWLRTNIHHFGSKYEPQELVERVTGSKITPEPYLGYLNEKYGKIYDL